MSNINKYYKVTALLGHQSHYKYNEITFYFKARSIMDAIAKARAMPGVKHNRSNTIKSVITISEEEFNLGRLTSAYEGYKK